MSEPTRRIGILEQIVRALQRKVFDLANAILRLEGQIAMARAGSGGGSGAGTTIYFTTAQVISAGGNVTGATVQYLAGGTPTTITSSGTIYNQGASATVSTSGKTIFLGANGDGTYIVVSQSC